MIYNLTPNWPLEHSPSIQTSTGTRARDSSDGTAIATIEDKHSEIIETLKHYHCIPVGESFPFVSEELAEHLKQHIKANVFFRPAKIIHNNITIGNHCQMYILQESDCINTEDSIFNDDGIVTYANFKTPEPPGIWVSNMPHTKKIIQICSQAFVDTIKKSKFSDYSFEFSIACLPFPTDAIERIEKKLFQILSEKTHEPDYQKNPFLIRRNRPDIFENIVKIKKLPKMYINEAAKKNLSKDEFINLLLQKSLLVLETDEHKPRNDLK